MKTAIIYGASRGIGKEIAKEFALNDYKVIATFNNNEESLLNLVNEMSLLGKTICPIKADVTNYKDCENVASFTISKFGKIDVAVINAGISKNNLLIDAPIEEINSVINTNLIGTIYAAKAVSFDMLKNHYGKIIMMSSMWGEVGATLESVYSASKGGIIAFCKALSKELGFNNINVNTIAPGIIDTEMNSHLSKEEIDDFVENIPISRVGTVQDIAKAAIFLASDQASYINGQILNVNGGYIV